VIARRAGAIASGGQALERALRTFDGELERRLDRDDARPAQRALPPAAHTAGALRETTEGDEPFRA
jgi:hypothetical protein